MADDAELVTIESDEDLVEVSDGSDTEESLSFLSWDIPPFPTTSREELSSLSTEELEARWRKMQFNVRMASKALKEDESRLSQSVLRLLKKNKEFSSLSDERDNSYWGGKSSAPPTLSLFLDPRCHSAYQNLSEKLDERTKKYDILYEKLSSALPDENLPTPFCAKSSVLKRIEDLEKKLAEVDANHKLELRQIGGAVNRAAVRLREMNKQLSDVKLRKKKAEADLWISKDNVEYWNLCGRIELCQKKQKELREKFGDPEEELNLEDLEEVDDTEAVTEAVDVDFEERLDYEVSDSEIGC